MAWQVLLGRYAGFWQGGFTTGSRQRVATRTACLCAAAHGVSGILHTLLLACDVFDPSELYPGLDLLDLIRQTTEVLAHEALKSGNLPPSLGDNDDRSFLSDMWPAQILTILFSIYTGSFLAALVLPWLRTFKLKCNLCCVQAGTLVPWSNRFPSSGCKAAETGSK